MVQKARPMSPHLQVYRWRPNMLVSILHRATGAAMATLAASLFVWWLLAAATGPEAYETFTGFMTSWFGYLLMFGYTWVVYQHIASGVRHLVMDTGRAMEPARSRVFASLTIVFSTVMTVVTWLIILA